MIKMMTPGYPTFLHLDDLTTASTISDLIANSSLSSVYF